MNFRPETRLDRARGAARVVRADVALLGRNGEDLSRVLYKQRLPVGDSDIFVMRAVTSFQFGIIQGKSPRRLC